MAKKRTAMSYEVSSNLIDMGFPADFARIVGEEMNTDFVAKQMLGYLRDAKPQCMEDVVDEMLGILEFRDKCVKRQIAKRRPVVVDDLFIRSFSINWENKVGSSYVSDIEPIRKLNNFVFSKNITFFAGENGSGKSTLLEGIAVACGLNPEGGTQNYSFHTYDDYSELGKAIRLTRGRHRPQWSYFLRAESFYNVATAAMTEYNDDGMMPDYHARSHGESFLDFIQCRDVPGLYLMDEPEAALSPQRQMALLIHLVKMAEKGSQFIIATHSPILLGTPEAEIFSFDNGEIRSVAYEDTESYQLTKLFIENRDLMVRQLLREDTEPDDDI